MEGKIFVINDPLTTYSHRTHGQISRGGHTDSHSTLSRTRSGLEQRGARRPMGRLMSTSRFWPRHRGVRSVGGRTANSESDEKRSECELGVRQKFLGLRAASVAAVASVAPAPLPICNSRVVCMYAHRPHTRTHRLNCTIVLKRNAALHRDQAPPVQQGVHRWT